MSTRQAEWLTWPMQGFPKSRRWLAESNCGGQGRHLRPPARSYCGFMAIRPPCRWPDSKTAV